MDNNHSIVLFTSNDKDVTVDVRVQDDTVWLNRQQMSLLFDRDIKTIGKHINNALKEELDASTVAKFATVQKEGERIIQRNIEYYNLDVIISVGYRVKSKRGVEFRRWANSVLKQYILEGYALNEKRLQILQKTVSIQNRMLADAMNLDSADVLKAVNQYEKALELLDEYDHQTLKQPKGEKPIYQLSYEECKTMVSQMRDTFHTDVFGVEKESGKVKGIIASIYQTAFGQDVYPSIEEKAANLLYFMVKDHPYIDGCKRIASSLFLEFLDRNNALFRNKQKIISDGELVAITLMIAESNPSEKNTMVTMVMNFLTM